MLHLQSFILRVFSLTVLKVKEVVVVVRLSVVVICVCNAHSRYKNAVNNLACFQSAFYDTNKICQEQICRDYAIYRRLSPANLSKNRW